MKLLRTAGTPEGCRESTRISYDQHLRKAIKGRSGGNIPYQTALYGALATWYNSRRRPVIEHMIWGELSPFLLIPETDAREAIAEYTLYLEDLEGAYRGKSSGVKVVWLAQLINCALRTVFSGEESPVRYPAAMSANYVGWENLLEDDVKSQIDAELKRISSIKDEDDKDNEYAHFTTEELVRLLKEKLEGKEKDEY